MGRDKARLRLGGKSLVEHAAEKLSAVVSELVIADRELGLVAGYRSIADGPGRGPVAGILGAAAARPGWGVLALACDLPAVPAALLRALRDTPGGDVCVPRWRRGVEPLCACYRPAALAALETAAASGRFALYPLLREEVLRVRYLEGPALAAFGSAEELFLNLNTPEQLARLRRRSSDMP